MNEDKIKLIDIDKRTNFLKIKIEYEGNEYEGILIGNLTSQRNTEDQLNLASELSEPSVTRKPSTTSEPL
jgi:hypothetical protein